MQKMYLTHFKMWQQEVPEDDSCESKQVAKCYVTLNCCVCRCIYFVCDVLPDDGPVHSSTPGCL